MGHGKVPGLSDTMPQLLPSRNGATPKARPVGCCSNERNQNQRDSRPTERGPIRVEVATTRGKHSRRHRRLRSNDPS